MNYDALDTARQIILNESVKKSVSPEKVWLVYEYLLFERTWRVLNPDETFEINNGELEVYPPLYEALSENYNTGSLSEIQHEIIGDAIADITGDQKILKEALSKFVNNELNWDMLAKEQGLEGQLELEQIRQFINEIRNR